MIYRPIFLANTMNNEELVRISSNNLTNLDSTAENFGSQVYGMNLNSENEMNDQGNEQFIKAGEL